MAQIPDCFAVARSVFGAFPEDVARLRAVCDSTDRLRNQYGSDDDRVQFGERVANDLKGLFTRRIAWACYLSDRRFGLRRKSSGAHTTRADGVDHATDVLMWKDNGQIIDVMSDRDVSWSTKDEDTQPLDQWVEPMPEGGAVPVPEPPHVEPVPSVPVQPSAPSAPDPRIDELMRRMASLEEGEEHFKEVGVVLSERMDALALAISDLVVVGRTERDLIGLTHNINLAVTKRKK